MPNSRDNKTISLLAIAGAALLFIGTSLHPMHEDPNRPLAAFMEYAHDRHWIATHLVQLLGVVLMTAALVLLSRKMHSGPAGGISSLGHAGAVAGMTTAAALQAVDGVALKAMVDAWAAASASGKAALFPAVLAVRQVEIGLAAMTSLLLGATVALYGCAQLIDRRFPAWLGWLGVAGGVPGAAAGVVIAYTDFSEAAMLVNMPASIAMLGWMAALGIFMWRTSRI